MQYTVSLKLNHVFQRLYRRGARSAAPTLALYSRPNGRDHNRLGLTTGAKLTDVTTPCFSVYRRGARNNGL